MVERATPETSQSVYRQVQRSTRCGVYLFAPLGCPQSLLFASENSGGSAGSLESRAKLFGMVCSFRATLLPGQAVLGALPSRIDCGSVFPCDAAETVQVDEANPSIDYSFVKFVCFGPLLLLHFPLRSFPLQPLTRYDLCTDIPDEQQTAVRLQRSGRASLARIQNLRRTESFADLNKLS